MSCQVKSCKSIKRLTEEPISFHCFPREGPIDKWLKILNIDPDLWKWSRTKMVCSKHFKPEDYQPNRTRKFLKANAVPSLLLNAQDLRCSNTSNIAQNASLVPTYSTSDQILPKVSGTSALSSNTFSNKKALKRIKRKRTLNEALDRHSTSINIKKKIAWIEKKGYKSPLSILIKKNEELKKSQIRYRKQLYHAQKQILKLKKKVTDLQTVIDFVTREEQYGF